MASVFLTEVAIPPIRMPWIDAYSILKDAAANDRIRAHSLTDSPESADIILCTDSGARTAFDVLSHPLYKRFMDKFFFYSTMDHVFPFVPGIYPSIARPDYDSGRTRSGCYIQAIRSDHCIYSPVPKNPRYLFSFVGAADTAPLRAQLEGLKHSRYYFLDTSRADGRREGQNAEVYEQYKKHYVEVLQQSKFVLCPRGAGPSSIRLFEVMRIGRVPVIISDDWVEPVGPDWRGFSVRIPQRGIARIPMLLEEMEDRAVEMGARAREAWQTWFEKEIIFHRIVESCINLKSMRHSSERVTRWFVRWRMLTPRHFRPAFIRGLRYQLLKAK